MRKYDTNVELGTLEHPIHDGCSYTTFALSSWYKAKLETCSDMIECEAHRSGELKTIYTKMYVVKGRSNYRLILSRWISRLAKSGLKSIVWSAGTKPSLSLSLDSTFFFRTNSSQSERGRALS